MRALRRDRCIGWTLEEVDVGAGEDASADGSAVECDGSDEVMGC